MNQFLFDGRSLTNNFPHLGTEFSKKVGISPDQDSRIDHYDPTVDPSIANVFAACAFRFAHTLLPVSFVQWFPVTNSKKIFWYFTEYDEVDQRKFNRVHRTSQNAFQSLLVVG